MKNFEKFFASNKNVIFIYSVLSLIYFFNPLLTGKLLAGSDFLAGIYVSKKWLVSWLKKFYFPLWFPYERLGYGTLEAFWMDIFTPTGALRLILPAHVQFIFGFFFYTVLAGFGTYLFLKELKLNSLSSFIGGIFYAFSGILITNTSAGHLNRLISASLMPLVLYFLYSGIKRKSLFYFIFAGATAGWQFLGGQFQMTYFCFLMYIPFFFYVLLTEKTSLKEKLKMLIYSMIGISLTFLLFSAYSIPILKNMKFVARGITRGYDYAASWPMTPLESFDFIFVNFTGFFDTYWGPNYFRIHHIYLGLFPVFFFILSFYFKNKKYIWFFFITFLITLTFAWGKFFFTHKIFYHLVPGIKKFRGPSNIIFITTFCIIILSAYGLEYFKNNPDNKKIKITFLFFLILFIFSLLFTDFLKGLFRQFINSYQPVYHLTSGTLNKKLTALEKAMTLFRQNLLLLIFEIIIVLIIFKQFKKYRNYLFLIFPLIMFVEVFIFLRPRFLKVTDLEKYTKKDKIIEFLENKKNEFRVFYFPGTYMHENDGILTLYGIEDIGGYVANPLQRFQDFIGAGRSVMFNPQNLIKNRNLINLLNVRYLILPSFPLDTSSLTGRTKSIVKFLLDYTRDMNLVLKTQQNFLFENKKEFGRFFVKNKIYAAESKEEALSLLINKNYGDSFVVVERKFLPKNYENYNKNGEIIFNYEILDKKPDFYKIKVKLNKNAPLVFSMCYHPAWNAYIDGRKVKVFPADYTLMGILVPEGEHEIIFRFGSRYHFVGIFLTLTGFFIIFLSFALFILKR